MKTFIKNLFLTIVVFLCSFQKIYGNEKIYIGLIVPMSGEYKEIGDSIVKSVRLAINKIDDSKIIVIPKDTRNDPVTTLKVSKELNDMGVSIIIGPVFNENASLLSELSEVIFLSLTNKSINNPKNVISSGVNATSQILAIQKLQEELELKRSIFLIPDNENKNEIDNAIAKTNIKLKDKFFYSTDPTLLTAQIEKLTVQTKKKEI